MGTNFDKDLKIGNLVEEIIAKHLKKEFPTIRAHKKKSSEYDLIDDDGYTFEVKWDRMSEETPNTVVEYYCNRKPSGISTTKAIEWIQVYYLDHNWVFSRMTTNDLKAYLHNNFEFFHTGRGGDGNRARLIFLDKDDFATEFDFTTLKAKTQ
jgi:hypothetical protein